MENEDFNVPADFPRPQALGAVAGFQPKLLLKKQGEKYYAPGCSPEELHARWDVCEDLAQQFVLKCKETKSGKRADVLEVDILEQYCLRSMKAGWGAADEMRWVFRRVAAVLNWPAPPSALANGG